MPSLTRRDLLRLLALSPVVGFRGPAARPAPHAQGRSRRPNILILVFDAFSAFHSPLHGYPRATTPNLSRFADRAVVFHSHYSAGGFTTSGTASLLTGAYPWAHRAVNLQSTAVKEYTHKNLFRLLADAGYYRLAYSHNLVASSLLDQFRGDMDAFVPTMALCLQDPYVSQRLFADDFTPAVHAEALLRHRGDASSSLFLYPAYRLWMSYLERRRHDRYGDRFPRGLPGLTDQVFLLEDAVDWTMRQLTEMPEPFLAYLHFLPPHDPYNARSDCVGRFDDAWVPPGKPYHPLSGPPPTEEWLLNARREYDEHLAYADAEFGRLLDFMEAHGVLDTTYVIVTSDHGELFERGIWGHLAPVLFDSLLRVPLIVSTPGRRVRRDVHAPTSSVDLLPTLAHLAGLPRPEWSEGRLLPVLSDGEADSGRVIYAVDAKESRRFGPLRPRTVTVLKDGRKLTHYLGYAGFENVHEMYDLNDDPQEVRNIYSPPAAAALQELLDEKLVELERRP